MKLILIFIASILIGISSVFIYHITKTHPNEPVKNIIQNVVKPTFSIADAPSEAVKGTITQISGDVLYESRTATVPSGITSPVIVQQGESIQTKDTGSLNLEFPSEAKISIFPKTEIDFIQTLPVDFVVNIASGSAEITKTANVPVSIRTLHLLIRENSGDLSIGINTDKPIVNLNIIKGSITTAYNDLNLVSHIVNFKEGQKVIFNDSTRSFE